MKNKNGIQKHIQAWLLVCSLAFAAGCGGNSSSVGQTDHDNRFFYQSNVAAGEDGYYFTCDDGTLEGNNVYFFDAGTGQAVKLCGKADCTHDTEECNANVKGMTYGFITYASNKIYYLQTINRSRIALCSMEKDGTNHHEITTIYEIAGSSYADPSGFIHRNYLYYITYEENGTETLYRVKIEDNAKPEKYLESEDEELFSNFLVQGDDLYFVRKRVSDSQTPGGEIIRMSIETKEEEILYEYGAKQIISSMALTDGYLYYSIGTEGIRKRNLDTGKEEWFGTGLPEYAGIYTDGIYMYVDNIVVCDNAYFDEEDKDAYSQREILVLDMEGAVVDVISLSGHRAGCVGGDERFLFFGHGILSDGSWYEMLYYDKSQIGSGNAVIGHISSE